MTEAELYKVYKGIYLPLKMHPPEAMKYFEEFTFRPDDILIVTYPKSGTNWMQGIVPLIMSEGDPAPVETVVHWQRVPWLEVYYTTNLNLEQRPSPRILCTHLHYNMMPSSYYEVKPKLNEQLVDILSSPRVVYVMRNPKDVFTSSIYFHEMANFLVKPHPQTEFLHKFLDGKVIFGSWFDHVKGWLNAEGKERIIYVSYEEMIADLKGSVSRIAQFLEKSLDAEVIEEIADRCLFKNMKKNNMSNYSTIPREILDQTKSDFFRKGIAGDWKNQLTEAEVEYFDAVYKDKMKDVKYKFAWD